MDIFLHSTKPAKLNQEKVNNLNGPITNEEIETIIKSLPTKKENSIILTDLHKRSISNSS